MGAPYELDLEFTSPYKRTRLFVKNGRAFFGVWRPVDVALDGNEEEIIVQRGRHGYLDLIAHEVYGDRRLWRVIAQANRIGLPLEEVVPGLRLVIPKPTNVRAGLLAAGAELEEAEA